MTHEHYLQAWQESQELAEAMQPLIGRLSAMSFHEALHVHHVFGREPAKIGRLSRSISFTIF